MQIKYPKSLTIFVGIARIPVLVNSAAFRRTLREAAQVSAENHPDRHPVTRAVQREKLLLQSAYRRDDVAPSMVRTPIPWSETDPPLIFGRDGAFFGRSTVHPRDLTHVLALGGTGVGKTESVTKPGVAAALAYELNDGTHAAVLVIDPKAELIEKVRSVLSARGELDRLFVVGQYPPIKMFTAGSQLSQSDRLQKLKAYVPSSEKGGQNDYWRQLGEAAVLDFMQLEE